MKRSEIKETDVLILRSDFMDNDAHFWNRSSVFSVLKVTNQTYQCVQIWPKEDENFDKVVELPFYKHLYEHHSRASYILFKQQK